MARLPLCVRDWSPKRKNGVGFGTTRPESKRLTGDLGGGGTYTLGAICSGGYLNAVGNT